MSVRKYPPMDWGKYRTQRPRNTSRHQKRRSESWNSPDRVLLFGSYASGEATPDSDVDLMVIMPARNVIDQMVRIWRALDPPFAFDVLVRTPYQMAWRLKEGDWFLREVVAQGKVLYEKTDAPVDKKGRRRPEGARLLANVKPVMRDVVCFHCQQAVEKYLKALMQELGILIPRIHDIGAIIDLLATNVPSSSRNDLCWLP